MKGIAQKIRNILHEVGPSRTITYEEMAYRLDLVSNREKKPMYSALRDFLKRGEIIRDEQGAVRLVAGRVYRPAKKTSCMYRLIRANRYGTVTAADLVANCGVSSVTAHEYLRALTDRGITRRIESPKHQAAKYQLIKDPGPNLVRNDQNAEKMKRIRAAQKEALEKIDKAGCAIVEAGHALAEARKAVNSIGEQDDE